ncbi:MAG: Fe2+-dependent dioxygenase, partial [Myxococcota bacterium]
MHSPFIVFLLSQADQAATDPGGFMLLTISELLPADDVNEVRALARTLTWTDGVRTAGPSAAEVKHNEQAELTTDVGRVVHARLQQVVRDHPVIRAAARPRKLSALLLSRTGPGGGYGAHVDNAMMGRGADRLRTDLSFTLFLSDPGTYDGGELEIDRPGMVQSFKPDAGDLVLYPTSSVHRVAPVTRGERLACIGWIQSLVP